MSKTNELALTLLEMQAAIEVWKSVKQLNEGYKYLVSGISLEVYKESYQKWANLETPPESVYCHLGVYEKVVKEIKQNRVLIFIFALESDARKLVEATTFAVPFYNTSPLSDDNGSGSGDPIPNTSITPEEAGKQILNWTLFSDIWFKNEISYEQKIVEYIEIKFVDFHFLFNQKEIDINIAVGFFGMKKTTEVPGLRKKEDPRVIASLVFGSKPISTTNTKQEGDTPPLVPPVYVDVTRPVPPFLP